jgi:hypothetical protein
MWNIFVQPLQRQTTPQMFPHLQPAAGACAGSPRAFSSHIFWFWWICVCGQKRGTHSGGDMVKIDLRAIQHYKAQDERV